MSDDDKSKTPPDDDDDTQEESNEAVRRFLSEKEAEDTHGGGTKKLNLDPEVLGDRPGSSVKEVPLDASPKEKPDTPPTERERHHPVTDPELKTARKTFAELLKEPGVDLTRGDYQLFVKHLMSDEPIQMSVEPLPGVTIVMRDCTVYENNLIMHTLTEDQKAVEKSGERPRVYDPVSYATYAQIYHVAMRLVSMGTMQYDPIRFDNTKESYTDAAERLRAHAAEHIESMPSPKWAVVERAMRVVNTKLILLREELREHPENFSGPANSDS